MAESHAHQLSQVPAGFFLRYHLCSLAPELLLHKQQMNHPQLQNQSQLLQALHHK
jgi:hypothetical protein